MELGQVCAKYISVIKYCIANQPRTYWPKPTAVSYFSCFHHYGWAQLDGSSAVPGTGWGHGWAGLGWKSQHSLTNMGLLHLASPCDLLTLACSLGFRAWQCQQSWSSFMMAGIQKEVLWSARPGTGTASLLPPCLVSKSQAISGSRTGNAPAWWRIGRRTQGGGGGGGLFGHGLGFSPTSYKSGGNLT